MFCLFERYNGFAGQSVFDFLFGLRNQFFAMGQDENAAPSDLRKAGEDDCFARSGGETNHQTA